MLSGATQARKQYEGAHLGALVTPFTRDAAARIRTHAQAGQPWLIDNGCWSRWDPQKFEVCLKKYQGIPNCVGVLAPDVVGNWQQTHARFEQWHWRIRSFGYPVGFALQCEQPLGCVPWLDVDLLFIAGCTPWKFSAWVREAVAFARSRGIWVHWGRANSAKRARYAEAIGCHSLDGSGFTRFTDQMVPRVLPLLSERHRPTLIDGRNPQLEACIEWEAMLAGEGREAYDADDDGDDFPTDYVWRGHHREVHLEHWQRRDRDERPGGQRRLAA